MSNLDYKKQYPELYAPKAVPALVEVPEISFLMVDGAGDPNGEAYAQAVELLYGLSYTIKMSHKSGDAPEGFFEYTVPPLEGLWWCKGDSFDYNRREDWLWTSMIRQPDFVTPEVLGWAKAACAKKKPGLDCAKVRLERFSEGLCAQMLHTGPYAEEPATVAVLHRFMAEQGLTDETGLHRKHHELYLADPRRTAPEKLRTVLRLPVRREK